MARQRPCQLVEHGIDRQGRVEGQGQFSDPSSPAKAGDPVNADITDYKDREYWIPRLRGV
jgi:hypothetical protein